MTRLSRITICIFFASISTLWSQHKLSGHVKIEDGTSLPMCTVYINDNNATLTDSLGYFEFLNLSNGSYTLHITETEFHEYRQVFIIEDKDVHCSPLLKPQYHMLEDVVLVDENIQGSLRPIDNMGIYEGKKSEVIAVDKLVANLATNNARQVYARVPGLNIWENDGAGVQLSIGGRGLDPNRTSNFNVRQNGYDISADALGYPESYYTPPVEAIDKIHVVRGAASLQYGTQFGGLLNFMLRKPVTNRKIQLVARQSIGSFGFYNSFTSLSGTVGKLSYYTYFQYKSGEGWRPNSAFENYNFYTNVNYQISKKTKIGLDITLMDYLAKQPGGISDAMFEENPRQSIRERNWFKVGWNMAAVHFNHKFNAKNEFNVRLFGLYASRYSLGFRPNRVATIDDNSERDLIKGTFTNWGTEIRYLKRYHVCQKPLVLLVGARYYNGFNHSTQGQGSTSKNADFNYVESNIMTYDYKFPNKNLAFFAENIVHLSEKLSVVPGVRYEYINTTAQGYYGNISRDLAGNIIDATRITEYRNSPRSFVLAGIGVSYRPIYRMNVYGNISQNYRSITFNDMRVANPSLVIDPNMKDESGYSSDIGVRSEHTKLFNYDVSVFYLYYNNRIGEVLTYDERRRIVRKRGNIGSASTSGIESYIEGDVLRLLQPQTRNWSGILFSNMAVTQSSYKASEIAGVDGNQVEFVPKFNLKSGIKVAYKKIKVSFQYTYLSDQYSDATNAVEGGVSAVIGLIPAYNIMDLSCSYEYKIFKVEASINNLANHMYFTRRAVGYPGPGILPSDGRSFYLTLQVKI